jgi:hypothetical protein
VNPPRSAFLDVPLGHTAGPPNDLSTQIRIVADALIRGTGLECPSIVDLDYRWHDDDWKRDPLGWSRAREDSAESTQSEGDTRTVRSDQPRYQTAADRSAAEATPWDEQCTVCIGLPAPDAL